jgi:hypothetical protein
MIVKYLLRSTLFGVMTCSVLTMTIATAHADDEIEIECRAGSERTVKLDSSFETWTARGTERREFEAEIDIEDGKGFRAGQTVTFHVDGKRVASRKLVRDRDGDLDAEIEFKSWRSTGPSRFPAGFPAVATGTAVSVRSAGTTILSCTLR